MTGGESGDAHTPPWNTRPELAPLLGDPIPDLANIPSTGPALVIFQGLPGSGKTTVANHLLAQNPHTYRRVSRDHIRRMYFNSPFIPGHPDDREEYVTKLQLAAIGQLLNGYYTVIVDDTNLHQPHLDRMLAHLDQLRHTNALYLPTQNVVTVSFLHIPVDVCIDRDATRPKAHRVGAETIARMWRNWHEKRY